MAFYGWPISQCQSLSTPLLKQLQSGIRVIDIRLAIIDGNLIAYHGISNQRTPFPTILSDLHRFLKEHPSETIIVSIKQEDRGPVTFNTLVARDMGNSEGGWGMWFLDEGRIPSLGEVRGKCVMFSRFGGTPDGWPVER